VGGEAAAAGAQGGTARACCRGAVAAAHAAAMAQWVAAHSPKAPAARCTSTVAWRWAIACKGQGEGCHANIFSCLHVLIRTRGVAESVAGAADTFSIALLRPSPVRCNSAVPSARCAAAHFCGCECCEYTCSAACPRPRGSFAPQPDADPASGSALRKEGRDVSG
jgi:hypothetical protein